MVPESRLVLMTCAIFAAYLPVAVSQAQNVVINEFMAVNNSTLQDGNGAYSDWIEIYNNESNSINLDGWYLTDNAGNLDKWQFPSTNIAAGGFLVVFASGKTGPGYVDGLGYLHTTFMLSGGGEYLALVEPGGLTVAHDYAPQYPSQTEDVSYGLTGGQTAYFTNATPGAANSSGAVGEQPKFSRMGGVFSGPFSLIVTADTAGATIRYTLDGSVPNAGSTAYSIPLSISTTTRIRARIFVSGMEPGPVVTRAYLKLAADIQNFDSKIPIVVIDSFGYDFSGDEDVNISYPHQPVYAAFVDTDPYGRAVITGPADFAGRAGMHVRGRSSRTWPKKSFTFAVWGENNQDAEASILDMPAGTDWVLHAPYIEKTLMRNYLTYMWFERAGHYSVRTRFAEVFISMDGGSEISTNDYLGVYLFMERIRRDRNRVNVQKLWPVDNAVPELTGGYILKFDNYTASETFFYTIRGFPMAHVYPKPATISANQQNYIRTYVNDFETVLYGPGFADPVNGYAKYVDVDSHIDYDIFREFTRNFDGGSAFMYKERGGKLTMGPLWDYNMALGNCITGDGYITAGWNTFYTTGPLWCDWWIRFDDDVDYQQKWIDRWFELRQDSFSIERIRADIAAVTNLLAEAQVRNFDLWPVLGVDTWWNPPGFTERDTYEKEVAWMRQWIEDRIAWIDSQFVSPPTFSQNGGLISTNFTLSMVSTATSIYYTLDGSDPRAPGGGVAVSALSYGSPISLSDNTIVKARAYNSSTDWSAPAVAVFIVNPSTLAISEVMYNPRDPESGTAETNYTASDFEFIEIVNFGTQTNSLLGIEFTDGIDFDFTYSDVTSIGPGQYVVVVTNKAAFTNRYANWATMNIAGEYAGSLNNGGERIRLKDQTNAFISPFSYNDARGWPLTADGAGHSLVPLIMTNQAGGILNYGAHWRASAYIDGSPGEVDPAPVVDVVLNEITAHTDYFVPPYDSNDKIELYNTTGSGISLTNWYLSDDADNLNKWAIPGTNVIGPGGWITFDEVTGFHNPITTGFGLNKAAEQVFLSYLPGTSEDRVADGIKLKGQENGVSLGRYPDGGTYWYTVTLSPNAANVLVGDEIRISEIMYHPKPTIVNPEDNINDEYLELYNPTAGQVQLWNPAGTWRIDSGIGYTFPSNTTIGAGAYLVLVSFDPTNTTALNAFLNAYALTNGQVQILGPYVDRLSNRGERVALERPQAPDAANEPVSWVIVDEVIYFDRDPWPSDTDGTGRPLTLGPNPLSGNDPGNWMAGLVGTPGGPAARVAITSPEYDSGFLVPFSVQVTAIIESNSVALPVQYVEFYDGVTMLGRDYSEPYELMVDTISQEGAHSLTAELVDNMAVTYTSPPLAIHVFTNVPVGEAGKDQTININYMNSVTLDGTLYPNGFPTSDITTVWMEFTGSTNVQFGNSAALDTTAAFLEAGTYVLRLTTTYIPYGNGIQDYVTINVISQNTLNRIPLQESFERYVNGTRLPGIDGWYAGNALKAIVETNDYTASYGGTYPLPTEPHELVMHVDGFVTNRFKQSSGHTNMWIDVIAEGRHWMDEEPPMPGTDVQIAVYLNTNAHLVVWHYQGTSNGWTELTGTSIGSNEWVRLKLEADYARIPRSAFRIWLNGSAVPNPGTWFECADISRNYFSELVASGEFFIDDLVVDSSSLAAMGTPISWLDNHGWNTNYNTWELADPDGDGSLTWQEYIMGTDPTNGNSSFTLQILDWDIDLLIRFFTVQATGPFYSGKSRYYDLERSTNVMVPGSWQLVNGYTNIPGDDSLVTHTNTLGGSIGYFRAKTRLEN